MTAFPDSDRSYAARRTVVLAAMFRKNSAS